MKTTVLWLSLGLLPGGVLLAQKPQQFEVKAGQVPANVIPYGERYRFETFQEGNLYFTHGTSETIRLNYNLLQGAMQFINPKGDTATLANEYALKKVRVGNTMFVNGYDEGYFEVLAGEGGVELATRQLLIRVRTENVADNGYGMPAGEGASVRTVREVNTSQQASADAFFRKDITYTLIDKNGRIYRATRTNFLKLWPNHKKELAGYIKAESIDFRNEADLKKLVQFAGQL